ncbi:hypothetical protein BDV96DRAFT_644714 [Lophiotrema nucula]|uniref:Uncharacterized protein n=1 Tax=Lophiotrema nucula TaxID=690887 RepID=A0A6A5ZFV3_9PLEO|nr:hypothetical protein BDV96DRAFT_644714 [Lophiotrema nucula]
MLDEQEEVSKGWKKRNEAYKEAKKSFERHFESYEDQLEEYTTTRDTGHDLDDVDADFGPIYCHRGQAATRRLIEAEQALDTINRIAKEVRLTNGEDQESNFNSDLDANMDEIYASFLRDRDRSSHCRKRVYGWLSNAGKERHLTESEKAFCFDTQMKDVGCDDRLSIVEEDPRKKRKLEAWTEKCEVERAAYIATHGSRMSISTDATGMLQDGAAPTVGRDAAELSTIPIGSTYIAVGLSTAEACGAVLNGAYISSMDSLLCGQARGEKRLLYHDDGADFLCLRGMWLPLFFQIMSNICFSGLQTVYGPHAIGLMLGTIIP